MLVEAISAAVLMLALLLTPGSSGGASDRLRPAALEADSYAETFTFVGDLDDGSYAQIQLSVTNLGPGSGHGICRALLVRPGQKPWTAQERVTSGKWRHLRNEAGEMLQIGGCRLRNEFSGLTVAASFDDRRLLLRYPFFDKAESPPGNVLQVKGGNHRTELVAPPTKVELQLNQRGEKPVRLQGGGYADHSRSTVEPKDLAQRWIRFRSLRGDTRLVLLARQGHDGAFAPNWLRTSAGAYQTLQRFSLERKGEKKAPTFAVEVQGEGERKLQLQTGELLYRHAPVEEIGGILAPVVQVFAGSPVTYTYRATLVGAGKEAVEGILEISLAEE